MAKANRAQSRKFRHQRVRKKISGTPERPRLAVYRSNEHIYAQIIDDVNGTTVVSASTVDKNLRSDVDGKTPKEQAKAVGAAIAERAKASGVETVVFDRGGFPYHGRVKALADASREAGLNF